MRNIKQELLTSKKYGIKTVRLKQRIQTFRFLYSSLFCLRPCHSSDGHSPASHRGGPGSRPGHVGFVVDEVAPGQVFSEYLSFPCQFSFHRLLHTHLSSGAGTISQLVAGVPSGLSLTPPQKTKIILPCDPGFYGLGFMEHSV
jgi:hypothetical protein